MRVLIQPPTVYGGSLGDEALIRGALSMCRDAHVVLQADRWHEWTLSDVWTLSNPDLSQYDQVVCIGADCIDGYYGLGPLDLIERYAGKLPVRVVSFSMRLAPSPDAVARLKRLVNAGVTFSARGSVSTHIFEDTVGPSVTQAADLAFLAPAEKANRTSGRYVVACVSRRDEGLRAIATAIRNLDRSYHVVILTHDRRDHSDLLSALTLADTLRDVPHTIVEPASAAEARGWLSGAELVITQRLHAAIGAFAEGVPAIALNHHDKMADTFFDLGVAGLMTDFPSELLTIVPKAMRERDILRDVIAHNLPKMRERARVNLEGLC